MAVVGINPAAAIAVSAVSVAPSASSGFRVSTAASALTVMTTQEPAISIVTDDLIHDTLALAETTVDSGGGTSRAASFYPGLLIGEAPQLICQQFFPCGFDPPHYPLLADATYPTKRSGSAPSFGRLATAAFAADVAAADATATERGATAAAGVSSVGLLGGLVRLGAASTSSTADTTTGKLSVTVRSSVTGIDIGPIHVGALESTTVVTQAKDGSLHAAPRSTATGVTIAGVPASLDSAGVHVAGVNVPLVRTALESAGLTIGLIDAQSTSLPRSVRGSASGLLVSATIKATGVPSLPNVPNLNRDYVALISIGGVGAVVSADDGSSVGGEVVLPVIPGTSPAPYVPGVFGDGGDVVSQAPSSGEGEVSAPVATGAYSSTLSLSLDDLDLSTLMLVLLIGVLVMLLGWRLLAWISWRRQEGQA